MEDVRITREEFTAMKESGALPFGQVPSLEVDGQVLAQSSAILRYVATVGGLHPSSDPLAAAQIDSIVSEEEDMFCGVSVSRYGPRFGFDLTDEYRAVGLSYKLTRTTAHSLKAPGYGFNP
jgi:glutathione S-transferase